ncbi:MAG: lytic transglycosylase domain-containing protein [Candidatus Binataceae bacterium]
MKIALVAVAAAALMRGSPAAAQNIAVHTFDTEAMFRVVGTIYRIDPRLLEAIAYVESRGNPGAVSPKGAEGLMQLMPETSRRFSVGDPFDPVDNALAAARFIDYLRRWQAATPGLSADLPELLAAYNAGEGAVEKYRGIPPYAETRDYVQQVLIAYLLGAKPPGRIASVADPRLAAGCVATGQPAACVSAPAGPLRSATREPAGVSSKAHAAAKQPADPLAQLAEIRREREQEWARVRRLGLVTERN